MHSLSKLVSSVALVGLLALPPLQAHANLCGDPTAGTPQVVVCDSEDIPSGKDAIDAPPLPVPYKVTSNGLSVTIAEDIIIDGVDVGTRTATFTISAQVQTLSFSRLRRAIVIETDEVSSGENGITVKSKGNIDAGNAIDITSRNHNDIKVEVTAGVLRNNQSAIKVQGTVDSGGTNSHRGNIDVTLGGTAVIRGHPKQYREQRDNREPANMFEEIEPRGIEVNLYALKGGNVNVALKDTAKIEGGIMDYGIYILDEFADEAGTPSETKVTTEEGTLIGSDSAEINKDGVYVRINGNHSKKTVTVVHKGKIYAKGNGIKIEHKHEENSDSQQTYAGGTATLTIGKTGLVQVSQVDSNNDNFGISLNTPDKFKAGEGGVVGMRKQSVTVHGKVFGGKNGGAIHLEGGGTVTLGRDAMLMPKDPGSKYSSVKVTNADTPANDEPNLVIQLDRNFKGIKNIENLRSKTDFKYRTTGSGDYTDLVFNRKLTLTVTLSSQMSCGFYNDCTKTETDEFTAMLVPATLTSTTFSLAFNRDADFKPETKQTQTPSKRGKVYEALPSVVHDVIGFGDICPPTAMSGTVASVPSQVQFAQNGMMATTGNSKQTHRNGWVSIEHGDGDRRLRKSFAGSNSYKLSYSGFAAGVGLPGVSGTSYCAGIHRRQGEAKVADGGIVDVSGNGAGFGVARELGSDLSVSGWLSWTRFGDIEVTSTEVMGGNTFQVNKKTKGTAYTLGMNVAKSASLGDLALTQRGGLTWSSVSMNDFDATSSSTTTTMTYTDKVSVDKASGFAGRYGVIIERVNEDAAGDCCRLFGSVDIEHDFDAKRTVKVTNHNQNAESEIKTDFLEVGFRWVDDLECGSVRDFGCDVLHHFGQW